MQATGFARSSDWRDALWTALTLFVGLAGLHVLFGMFSQDPFEWEKVLEAALLGLWLGLISWITPGVQRLLQSVSPEQLRVTLTALLIAAGFFGMGLIMSIGELGSFLANWPLWLAVYLLFGFVLAVVGASGRKADKPSATT